MRVYQSTKTVISKDNSSTPQEIKYSSTKEVIDTTSIGESLDVSGVFPVGTTAIPMSTITAGKFIEITPTNGCTLEIDTEQVDLIAGKKSIIWATFAALNIIVAGVSNQIDIVIGGD